MCVCARACVCVWGGGGGLGADDITETISLENG